jgi:hypothetical protein
MEVADLEALVADVLPARDSHHTLNARSPMLRTGDQRLAETVMMHGH